MGRFDPIHLHSKFLGDAMSSQRRGAMQVHVKAVDDAGALTFEGHIAVDPLKLIVLAEAREELARTKGEEFTRGAVPFWALQLLNAAQEGQSADELHMLSINVAMAAWLADSIYGDLSADEFIHSNLHFTYLPSGAVKYARIRVE